MKKKKKKIAKEKKKEKARTQISKKKFFGNVQKSQHNKDYLIQLQLLVTPINTKGKSKTSNMCNKKESFNHLCLIFLT